LDITETQRIICVNVIALYTWTFTYLLTYVLTHSLTHLLTGDVCCGSLNVLLIYLKCNRT